MEFLRNPPPAAMELMRLEAEYFNSLAPLPFYSKVRSMPAIKMDDFVRAVRERLEDMKNNPCPPNVIIIDSISPNYLGPQPEVTHEDLERLPSRTGSDELPVL